MTKGIALDTSRVPALTLITLLAALAALAGCDAPTPDPTPSADTAVEDPVDTSEAVGPDTASDTASGSAEGTDAPVRVWFVRGDGLVPAPRPAADRTVRSALESLVAGPTSEERREGLSSWFGDDTRNVLREVRSEGDRVIVDFDESLPQLIPGAGSSAGSEVLLGALDSTVFQFPEVAAVEYRMGGSCDAFWEWLQRECIVIRR